MIDLSTNVKAAQVNPESKPTPMPRTGQTPDIPMRMMVKGGAGDRVYGDYNTIDMMEAESSKIAKIEMWMAKAVGTKLARTYPGREWGVQVNVMGGIMVITCPSLSNEKGYHLHTMGKNIYDLEAAAVRAGGEILERYGISRRAQFDSDILETLDRDFKDEVLSADAAPEAL